MLSPCKDCNRRVINCHSTCDEYLVYKQSREEIRMAKAEAYQEGQIKHWHRTRYGWKNK